MKSQTDTAMQCYQSFTLLDKFIVRFIQFLKSQITWNTFNVYETGTFLPDMATGWSPFWLFLY